MRWDTEIFIPVVAIVAWAVIVVMRIREGSRRRELAHRERMAMIERGLVPSPEKDPEQFERMMRWQAEPAYRDRVGRFRTVGVLMVCIGVGVTLMLAAVDEDDLRQAIGIGGMVAMIGVAFLLNAYLWSRQAPSSSQAMPSVPPRPNEPR